MAIHFYQNGTKFHVEQKRQIKSWLKTIIEQNDKITGDISIILQDDETQHELNISALNHNTYTDIITFNYNQGNVISGDLFLSIDRIKENATKFAEPLKQELLRVMAHGVLHLIGFNDKNPNEIDEMRRQEQLALKLYNELFHVEHD